jgi:hypothetical protein
VELKELDRAINLFENDAEDTTNEDDRAKRLELTAVLLVDMEFIVVVNAALTAVSVADREDEYD